MNADVRCPASSHRGRRPLLQILATSRDPWWMRRARPPCRVPDTERRALSTLQRAGFVGWISAAHPPSASRPARCWRRPPKFGIADANQSHFLGADLTPDDLFTLEFLDIPAERLPNHYRNLIDASGTRIFDTWYG
ncbi:hypothetical protein [Lamprocystis purpurea]|uniref:hypothetical protein n=1 Tax=Lamprocystis purpurea TaxID=61598 RepID=UPI00146ECED8|nr:hypothetical protein [Lamprocystis purpurea]